MIHTEAGKQLLQTILDNPTDWDLFQVYADFLEENGDPYFRGWRWIGTNQKSPAKWPLGKNPPIHFWYSPGQMRGKKIGESRYSHWIDQSILDGIPWQEEPFVLSKLDDQEKFCHKAARFFLSSEHAYQALAKAVVEVRIS